MAQKYYAMDTGFYSSMGLYSFEDRCEITKEVGFDATYLSVWDGRRWKEVEQLHGVRERFGLEVAAVYVVLDLAKGVHADCNTGILEMLKAMPEGVNVELAIMHAGAGIQPSDPAGDDAVVNWLEQALLIAEARNINILLYTHYTHWCEKHDDALRICERINHKNLGIVFCGFHWYAADGQNLFKTLKHGLPFIKHVNLSGSRRSPLGWGRAATIETLDVGEMDNFTLIATLRRLGYTGYLGYQGWDENGDAFAKLTRSLTAMRGMVERAERHPHWARHIEMAQ